MSLEHAHNVTNIWEAWECRKKDFQGFRWGTTRNNASLSVINTRMQGIIKFDYNCVHPLVWQVFRIKIFVHVQNMNNWHSQKRGNSKKVHLSRVQGVIIAGGCNIIATRKQTGTVVATVLKMKKWVRAYLIISHYYWCLGFSWYDCCKICNI